MGAGPKPHQNMGGRPKNPSEFGRPAQTRIGVSGVRRKVTWDLWRPAQSRLGSLAYRLKSHWDYGREERSPIGIWAAGAKPLGDFRREAQSRTGILGGGAKPHRNIGGLHKVAWIFGVQVKAASGFWAATQIRNGIFGIRVKAVSGFWATGAKPHRNTGNRHKTPSAYRLKPHQDFRRAS